MELGTKIKITDEDHPYCGEIMTVTEVNDNGLLYAQLPNNPMHVIFGLGDYEVVK